MHCSRFGANHDADQHLDRAQFNIGVMYVEDRGVEKDYAEAMTWYRKAADQDYAPAQSGIGFLYRNGLGVDRNDNEALKWYSKAAEQGLARAQFRLGELYDGGKGIRRDALQAYKWYTLAIGRFSKRDESWKERATKSRDALAAKMTVDQITDAKKLAQEWRPRRRS